QLTIDSAGHVGGSLLTGLTLDETLVDAVMASDGLFVAGVTTFSGFDAKENGLLFLQKEPALAARYVASDLAGPWELLGLNFDAPQGNTGFWLFGLVTFDINGNLVPGQSLVFDALGREVDGLSADVSLDTRGFLSGGFSGDSLEVNLQATMFASKGFIIGVDDLGSNNSSSLGLFSMTRLGPPPPA